MYVYAPALQAAAPTVFMGLVTGLATPVRTPKIHWILYFVQNFRLRIRDLDPLGTSPFYPQLQHMIQHLVSSVCIRRRGQGSHQPVIFQSRHELLRSLASRDICRPNIKQGQLNFVGLLPPHRAEPQNYVMYVVLWIFCNVFFSSACCWPSWFLFVSDTFSSLRKTFHPLVNCCFLHSIIPINLR